MRDYIASYIQKGVQLRTTLSDHIDDIIQIAEQLYDVFNRGNKVLLCGNGGSASDAQHVAAELVNRFRHDRQPLPAIALTTDTSVLTAISNDYSYDEVFSKQVEALATEGDCLIAISTSGTSPNIIQALRAAREKRCTTISLTGKDGGNMPPVSDICLIIPSYETPLIQEMHLTIEHLICDIVEQMVLENPV